MFGMEAAILCPSGTMTNQIAIKVCALQNYDLSITLKNDKSLFVGAGIQDLTYGMPLACSNL